MASNIAALKKLPQLKAQSIRMSSWSRVMRSLSIAGKLLVTNQHKAEAVILSPAEYARLVRAAQSSNTAKLDAMIKLRRRYDERLAVLSADDAGDRLRSIMRNPSPLNGRVRSGSAY